MKRRCKTCEFCQWDVDKGCGECFRHPPAKAPVPYRQGTVEFRTVRPTVLHSDWCGEWRWNGKGHD